MMGVSSTDEARVIGARFVILDDIPYLECSADREGEMPPKAFRAIDLHTGRDCFGKFVFHRDTIIHQRAIREATALSSINHPNVVQFAGSCDVATHQGPAFWIFTYDAGPTVQQLLDDGRKFDQKEAVEIGIQLLEGWIYAYQYGLHRDIKTSNVCLRAVSSSKGGPLLLVTLIDWGLFKPSGGAGGADITIKGLPLGTRHWMAPSVARGNPASQGSDLYAIVRLVMALSGQDSAFNDTLSELHYNQNADNRSFTTLPSPLPQLFAQAMREDPALTAETLLDGFQSALGSLRVASQADPVPNGDRTFFSLLGALAAIATGLVMYGQPAVTPEPTEPQPVPVINPTLTPQPQAIKAEQAITKSAIAKAASTKKKFKPLKMATKAKKAKKKKLVRAGSNANMCECRPSVCSERFSESQHRQFISKLAGRKINRPWRMSR